MKDIRMWCIQSQLFSILLWVSVIHLISVESNIDFLQNCYINLQFTRFTLLIISQTFSCHDMPLSLRIYMHLGQGGLVLQHFLPTGLLPATTTTLFGSNNNKCVARLNNMMLINKFNRKLLKLINSRKVVLSS